MVRAVSIFIIVCNVHIHYCLRFLNVVGCVNVTCLSSPYFFIVLLESSVRFICSEAYELIGDSGFPRSVEAVNPRRLAVSHCGEGARRDR